MTHLGTQNISYGQKKGREWVFTKTRESPWFTFVWVVCHISMESSWQGLKLFFKSHLNWRFSQEIMGLQSRKNLNFENFGTPNLGVVAQNVIWMQAPWLGTKNNIRGKVVASPKSGPWRVLWVRVCAWRVCAPKMLQLCIN
jgi:hypothetical protein